MLAMFSARQTEPFFLVPYALTFQDRMIQRAQEDVEGNADGINIPGSAQW